MGSDDVLIHVVLVRVVVEFVEVYEVRLMGVVAQFVEVYEVTLTVCGGTVC